MDEEVLFERVQRRGIKNPAITKEDLWRWMQAFQAPTTEEMALF
jgi:hypothetical protein